MSVQIDAYQEGGQRHTHALQSMEIDRIFEDVALSKAKGTLETAKYLSRSAYVVAVKACVLLYLGKAGPEYFLIPAVLAAAGAGYKRLAKKRAEAAEANIKTMYKTPSFATYSVKSIQP